MASPGQEWGVPFVNSSVSDSSSPLYLNSSNSLGKVLVSQVFDGFGFGAWKRPMIIALSVKNKLGFVDGSCV